VVRPTVMATLTVALAALIVSSTAWAAQDTADEDPALYYYLIAAPTEVGAVDQPNDNGGTIVITWTLSVNDTPDGGIVTGYVVRRARALNGPYVDVGQTTARSDRYVDSSAEIGVPFFYRVDALAGGVSSAADPVGPVISRYQWFNWGRLNLAVLGLLLSGAVLWWVDALKRGRTVTVRRIPALEAIGEAVGRATEMGRPILFVPGLQDMDDMQTVAAITILGRVAAMTAEYDARLEVPTTRALVMTAARDAVQRACLGAGRPDAFNPESIYYVTNEQFGYVAAINGLICRDRPATCLYFGAFFAESLILSETGRGVGAVQIAGTAETAQVPFFLAACDYVLIGEEFYAASAYLSGDPRQLGSLKGQDTGKVFAAAAIVLGCLLATAASLTGSRTLEALAGAVRAVFRAQ
jgi:hypothetical protein